MPIMGPNVKMPMLGPRQYTRDHLGTKTLHVPIIGPVKHTICVDPIGKESYPEKLLDP